MGDLLQGMRIFFLPLCARQISSSQSRCQADASLRADHDVRVLTLAERMESAIGCLASIRANRGTARAINAPTANAFQRGAAIFVEFTARQLPLERIEAHIGNGCFVFRRGAAAKPKRPKRACLCRAQLNLVRVPVAASEAVPAQGA
jgi:hypothetical protein